MYVVDLFDHNVHVLDRKEDNALVSVKVNNAHLNNMNMHCVLTAHIILYNTTM